MGLRYVKGLHEATARRIVEARAERAFASIDDFVRRTKLDDGATARLAKAGAFDPFERNRRGALWDGKRSSALPPRRSTFRSRRAVRAISTPSNRSPGTTRRRTSGAGHPLAPLRAALRAKRLPDAAEVRAMSDGRRTHYAGLVICRQRRARRRASCS